MYLIDVLKKNLEWEILESYGNEDEEKILPEPGLRDEVENEFDKLELELRNTSLVNPIRWHPKAMRREHEIL